MTGPRDQRSTETALTHEERVAIEQASARLSGSYYDILGVPRGGDQAAIRSAYLHGLNRFHPDVYWDRDIGELMTVVEAIHRAYAEAYEVLADPARRAGYDHTLEGRAVPPGTRSRDRAAGASTADPPAPVPPTRTASEPAAVRRSAWPRTAGRHPVVPIPPQRITPASTMPVAPPPRPTVTGTNDREADEARRALAGQRFASVVGRTVRPTPVPARPPSTPPWTAQSAAPQTLKRPPTVPPPRPGSDPDVGIGADGSSGNPSTRPTTREALLRLRAEYHLRERQSRRQELDEAVARAATAGDDQEVLNLLQSAAILSPEDSLLRARVERVQEAVAAANVERFSALARSAEKMGRWEPAASFWQRAASGQPDDAQLPLNAAEALLQANEDLGRAAELARRATQINPSLVAAHVCLARVFLAAGRTASARGALEAAVRLAPQAPAVVELTRRLKV